MEKMLETNNGDGLCAGRLALVIGLKARQDVNGKRATLEAWVSERERWRVKIAGTREILGVKAENLRAIDLGPIIEEVSDLELETLLRVLAAQMLAQQARLSDGRDDEREAWVQQRIRSTFADSTHRANSLSERFTRHGDDCLDFDIWLAVAKENAGHLSRHAKFKAISTEVSDALPGLMDALMGWTNAILQPKSGSPPT